MVVRAIDSVLAQQSVVAEVIVVDDFSGDGTPEALLQQYSERIRIVRLRKNRGVAFATNRGFDASSGDFIALLGDDDYWVDTSKLQKQLAVYEVGDTGLGMVGTWWLEDSGTEKMHAREPVDPENWVSKLLRGGGVICGSTPLIRRAAWIAAGGLDERMHRGTDSDLFRRVILSGYSGKILRVHTTVVDTSHGMSRITTGRGFSQAKLHAFANGYLLWKYRRQYVQHPAALISRVKRLIVTPLMALRR